VVAAAAATDDDGDEDGSGQEAEGNEQVFKVHWITQGHTWLIYSVWTSF